MTVKIPVDRSRAYRMAGALVGLAVALGGCTYTEAVVATASVPTTIASVIRSPSRKADRSVVLFVGHARGGLSASQRAESWDWRRSGCRKAPAPSKPTCRSAHRTRGRRRIRYGRYSRCWRRPRAARGLAVRRYHPEDPAPDGNDPVELPENIAVAGPCGLWPEDIGSSVQEQELFRKQAVLHFGCAYQRNMAAMVDNPSDLVQPRAETPAYTTRRTTAFEKYRKGTTSATSYPEGGRPTQR